MREIRFTELLVATVVGTYLLVALGATTAATDGSTPLAVGHYATGVGVGCLLALTTLCCWLDSHTLAVRGGVTLAGVGYAAQSLTGLLTLGGGDPTSRHLAGGLVVFALLVASLVQHLDSEVAESGRAAVSAVKSEPTTEQAATTTETTTEQAATTAETESRKSDDYADANRYHTATSRVSFTERLRAYVSLTKPRLMWLLCLLALAGMGLATTTGATLDGVTAVATLGGGVLAIGASGTFNHVYERDRDSKMDRTDDRPVATATVSPTRAVLFGLALTVASMATLLAFVNVLAAALTAAAIVYYAVVYTVLLKPTTRWNTVIGGGSGALPALIGWVAVTGSVGVPGLLLAAVVVCWTPAHFYNLAIVYRDDYERAGYPMLPVVSGIALTRRRILYWLAGTMVVAALLGLTADLGPLYATAAALGAGVFLWSVVRQYWTDDEGTASYRAFHASNAYLGVLLLALTVETLLA
jgi:protoheme IX farnesyltransferase